MKKTGTMLMSLMLISLVGLAQPRQRNMNPEEMAKRQTAQIKEAVGLDEKQEKKVYELNLETGKKMRALREEMQGGAPAPEGMREKMREIREGQDEKMKEILSENQWKKYEKFQEERRARWRDRRPGGRR